MTKLTNGEYVVNETIPTEIVNLQARGYEVVDEHPAYDALPAIEDSLEPTEVPAPVVIEHNN